MKIKDVSIKDLNKIYKLEQKVFKEDAFSKDLILKLIQKKNLFLKLEKKILIGFTILVKDRKDRVNIINFLINPDYQNKGYGSFLLEKAIGKIKNLDKDIKKIILNVKVENSIAIKLYQKFGFQIVQRIEKYYQTKDTAYLMELNVDDRIT